MKVFFSTFPMCYGRIQFFINHLKHLNYDVIVDDTIDGGKDDIWFIDFVRSSESDISLFFTENESRILNFEGKICFYSLDDAGFIKSSLISESIIKRIDGWITGIKHDGTSYGNELIYDKILLFPWFVIPNRPDSVDVVKNKNIVFWGHPTGGDYLYSTQILNPRIEAVGRLKTHENLSKFFEGGIVVHDVFKQPIPDKIEDIKVPYLNPIEMFKILDRSLISLCLPGNKRWSYRHLDSMRSKCAVISFPLNSEREGKWLYCDKFENEFYYINEDMTNLESICDRALTNDSETKQKALCGHNVYRNFFEINPDETFKLPVWFELKQEFEKRNVLFSSKNEYGNVVNLYGGWWGEPADAKRGGWWGWGHDLFFKELIEKENIKTVCEIGTYMGKSAYFFAKMLPITGKVVTIDSFKGSPEHYAKNLFIQLNDMYLNAVINLKLGEFQDKIQIINKKSCDVNLNEEFDLIYIDGPHDMHTVINDITKYRNVVRKDGILSGDDYLWPEVKKGVDFCVENGIIPPLLGIYRDTIWYCRIK